MTARHARSSIPRTRHGAVPSGPPLAAVLAVLAALSCCLPQCSAPVPAAGHFFVSAFLSRPASELSDLYKLCYQGRFGVGHMISSREKARDYLLEELAAMGDGPADPLLEPCSADGRMLRVNLRPFARASLNTELLLDAVMETVERVAPDTAVFLVEWTAAGAAIRRGALPFDAAAYDAFTAGMRARGYPVLHHSDAYRAAYRPAYRVVLREAFARRFPELVSER